MDYIKPDTSLLLFFSSTFFVHNFKVQHLIYRARLYIYMDANLSGTLSQSEADEDLLPFSVTCKRPHLGSSMQFLEFVKVFMHVNDVRGCPGEHHLPRSTSRPRQRSCDRLSSYMWSWAIFLSSMSEDNVVTRRCDEVTTIDLQQDLSKLSSNHIISSLCCLYYHQLT